MTLNRFLVFAFILTTILFSCKQNKTNSTDKVRRLTIEDVVAEGDISSDTVFNGLIKFYDTTTNSLVIEAYYKNGKLHGKRIDYYLNGKTKNIGFYESGKQTGTVSYFDSTGQLTSKQDFYYDLKAGSSIEYKNGKPSKYYFTSFDNEDLFSIDYDTLLNKEIKKINDNSFFFWHSSDIATITTTDRKLEGNEYFIYLINPPDFNFEYSLCVINNKDSILRTEKLFDNTKLWETFTLDTTRLKKGERFSLRLAFDRDLNDGEGEKGDMLKRL